MRDSQPHERVVVTGMGVITPVGHDIETFWQALLAGRSGVAPTTVFDASTFPTTFSAEVKNYDLRDYAKNPDLHKNASRSTRFAVGATVQACKQAAISPNGEAPADAIDRRRLGIYLGGGEGPPPHEAFFGAICAGWDAQQGRMDWSKWVGTALELMDPAYESEQDPCMAAAHLAVVTGARGPSRTCLTACAASTQAVGEATKLIRHGKADAMIAGGTHSMIHPLGLMGFNRLTALSTRNDSPETASRPFTAGRDGFVLGEGAAILVLESLSSAKRRGVEILAEVIGYGASSDAFRVTDMHEEGRGPVQAMKAALADAAIAYKDVDYINTHGTSTMENDSIETLAIKAVFKDRARQIPASSTKSVLGHLIGAAGAAEIIASILAIRDNIVPPTINLIDPDPSLDLDYVPNEPRRMPVNIVMKESFGFGGQNNVVILKRYA